MVEHRVGVFIYDKEKDRWSMECRFGDPLVYFVGDMLAFMFIWYNTDRFDLELMALEEEYWIKTNCSGCGQEFMVFDVGDWKCGSCSSKEVQSEDIKVGDYGIRQECGDEFILQKITTSDLKHGLRKSYWDKDGAVGGYPMGHPSFKKLPKEE